MIMFSHTVYNQVTAFLNETAALNDQQYGFRKGYSCVDLLTAAVDDWLLARDQKLSIAIVFWIWVRLLTTSAISSCSYFFKGSTFVGQCFGGFWTTSLEGHAELCWMIRHQTSSFAQREFPKVVCWDRCWSICMLRICILLQPDTMSLCQRLLMTCHSTVRGRQWSMPAVTSPSHWQASQVSCKAGGSQSTAKRLLQWLSIQDRQRRLWLHPSTSPVLERRFHWSTALVC